MQTSDNEKEAKKEQSDYDLQRILEESAKKTAALGQEIKDSSSRLANESKVFEQEVEKVQSTVEGELEVFNKTASAYIKKASETAKQILNAADEFTRSVNESMEKVELWSFYVVIAALVATLVLTGLIALLNILNTSFDPSWIIPALLIICIAASVNVTLRSMHKKFGDYEDRMTQSTKKAIVDIVEVISKPLELKIDPRNVNSKLSIIMGEFNRLIGAVFHFVPYVEKHYSWKNKEHRIMVFTQSIRNSLKSFGVTVDVQTEYYLRRFGPKEEDENEWLEGVSKKLSQQLGIPSEAISLAYYEYTDNTEGKRNEWNKILENRELLRQMTKILCKSTVVDVRYLNTEQSSLGAIEELLKKIQLFSLEEFRHVYYDFYAELARNKRNLISTLAEYGLKIDQAVETEVLGFVPSTTNREEWVDELLEVTAKLFSLNKDVIELIYSDKIGNYPRKNKCWEKMRHDASLQDFVKFLVQHGQLQLPSFYIGSTKSVKFVSDIIAQQDDYDLLRIVKEVSETFSKLDDQKKLLLRTIESFSIQFSEDNRDRFRSFLPPRLSLPDALIEHLEQELPINKDIIKLLYFDYTQDEVSRKTIFCDIARSELVHDLASLVLQKIGIEAEQEKTHTIPNMVIILKARNDFDIVELQNLFWKYSNLITYSSEMASFLFDEKLSSDKSAPDFETIHKIMQNKIQLSIYEQLKHLLEYMIRQHASPPLTMGIQELKDITLAALVLFLTRRGDTNAAQACEDAAHTKTKTTSRILYQYINLTQERKFGQKAVFLKEVIEGVMTGEYTDYSFLPDFESELANGYLYRSIHELLSARIYAVEKQIAKRDLLEQTLSKVKQAVRGFIDAELQADMIILLLKSEIISAYLITTRSKRSVIKGVVDRVLGSLSEKLAAKDTTFKDFLLLETEKKTAGGKYTRVGLVPREMTFEEFSQHFNTLFTEATKAYIESNQLRDSVEAYSANLIRIFPSDAAFKLVVGGSEAEQKVGPTHPVYTIKRLINEKLGFIDNLELLASLDGEAHKTIALRKVIMTIFDTRTSIYLLTRQVVDSIVVGRHNLLKNMENKDFDKRLMATYACKTLTELAINIHKKNERVPFEGKNVVKEEFSRNVAQIASSYGSKLGDQATMFSDAIFTMLDEIGTILSA